MLQPVRRLQWRHQLTGPRPPLSWQRLQQQPLQQQHVEEQQQQGATKTLDVPHSRICSSSSSNSSNSSNTTRLVGGWQKGSSDSACALCSSCCGSSCCSSCCSWCRGNDPVLGIYRSRSIRSSSHSSSSSSSYKGCYNAAGSISSRGGSSAICSSCSSSSSRCYWALSAFRLLHRSHLAKKLQQQDIRRFKHLDEVPNAAAAAAAAVAAAAGAAGRQPLRVEAERFARELLQQKHALACLFSEEQKAQLLGKGAAATTAAAAAGDADAAAGAGQAAEAAASATGRKKQLSPAQQQQLRRHLRKAMKAWRLLRPDAEPFYVEDAMMNLESKLNSLTLENSPLQQQLLQQQQQQGHEDEALLPASASPLSFNLPVLNAKAFVLAVSAVCLSISDDLELLLRKLQVEEELLPRRDSPKRLLLLLEALSKSFRLEKTPEAAGPWVARCWPRLRPLMPEAIQQLTDEQVAAWLSRHLRRVSAAQRRYSLLPAVSPQPVSSTSPPVSLSPSYSSRSGSKPPESIDSRFAAFCLSRLNDPTYDLGSDCLFDSWLVGEETVDRLVLSNNKDLLEAPQSLKGLAAFFGLTAVYTPEVEAAVARLFGTLEEVGLSDWLRAGPETFEAFLPYGEIPPVSVSPSDVATARLFLAAAARGKGSLLDFEAANPFKLLHGIPAKSVEEELRSLPENPFLPEAELDRHFNLEEAARCLSPPAAAAAAAGPQTAAEETLQKFKAEYGMTPLEALVDDELHFVRTAGPAEWQLQDASSSGSSSSTNSSSSSSSGGICFGGWKWKRPSHTTFDAARGVYVRERGGVDPQLALHELRQTLLQANRMMSMTKQGRVYYYRAIVAVGNGRGLFGIGIGFGSKPKDARSNAALAAIQRMQIIDLDDARVLTTPQHGQEYSAHVKIIPRPSGRGLRCNLRFLPLLYLTGLDNCKLTFAGPSARSRWFSRSKALMRALLQLQSRKTVARARGIRLDLLTAPGDTWTHWPDSWFRPIAASYEEKLRRIRARRHKAARWSFRSHVSEIVPEECRPEMTPYTWKPPLERWALREKQRRLTCHNVKQLTLAPSTPLSLLPPSSSSSSSSSEQHKPALPRDSAVPAALPNSSSSSSRGRVE
ncbi:hypothetical protein Efla_003046 [Eimeria flavescens]